MYLQIAHLHDPNLGPYVWAKVNMSIGPGIVLIPFWGATTLLNIYCTCMLLRRINQAVNETGPSFASRQFRFIARSIVESGFIYMSISLAHFIVWFTYDNLAVRIVAVLNVPLIGIAFNLILIRAAQRRMGGFGDGNLGEFTSINFSRATTHIIDIRPESKNSGTESGSVPI
ncbi:hypothetical protein AN958_08560 [Leucoagaricus sp. SymC.cos]|nr:hypothetical protein AN958_08560 [Leucoagaricus sp. SymC.cos]